MITYSLGGREARLHVGLISESEISHSIILCTLKSDCVIFLEVNGELMVWQLHHILYL